MEFRAKAVFESFGNEKTQFKLLWDPLKKHSKPRFRKGKIMKLLPMFHFYTVIEP